MNRISKLLAICFTVSLLAGGIQGCNRNSESAANQAAQKLINSLPTKIGVLRKLTKDLNILELEQEPWIRHEKYVVDYNHNII